ncbi:MAG: hypothetical protein Q8N63_00815 [Nanoarchaeota archaeon]|nr:hypothetical protein [Nanoarchaeota archaeon]
MKNLKTALFFAGGLVLILAGTTFIQKNKNTKVYKENPVEIKYTAEEQREIDYFDERGRLIWSSYAINKPSMIEKSVCEMIDKYPGLSQEAQGAVKKDLEDGLFFLNGLCEKYSPEKFAPYQAKAKELGLNIERIKNTGNE